MKTNKSSRLLSLRSSTNDLRRLCGSRGKYRQFDNSFVWKKIRLFFHFSFKLLVHAPCSFVAIYWTTMINRVVPLVPMSIRIPHRRTNEFSFHWTSECVDLSSIDVAEWSPSFYLESDSCLHSHQQAENNILYQQLKLQSINLDQTDFTRIRFKIFQWKSQESSITKVVRTNRFFSNQRQVQAIVDLKNNSNSKCFLPKAVQFTQPQ